MGKLTALRVKAMTSNPATKPGRYTDGYGLHLHIRGSGYGYWVLRFMRDGRLRDMGLGAYPAVSLAQAREAAQSARDLSRAGVDPIDRRHHLKSRDATGRTFKDAAEQFIKAQTAGWSNEKHAAQWAATLTAYAYPFIGDLHVAEVKTEQVLQILQPIWTTKTETASRLRGRIEAVLDSARAMRWCEGENPARWKGHLSSILPKPSRVWTVEHHPSLPWQEVPAFVAALRERKGMGPLAVEFVILTACRSGEVRGAPRREFDLAAKIWTIPKERMKAGRTHRVPLSPAALAVLERANVHELGPDDLVFHGSDPGFPMSDMTLTAALRRMNKVAEGETPPWRDGATGEPITVHGFRSSFRVWAGEQTEHPRELIEMALAHSVGNAVEAAYARTDLVKRRRPLMEEWGLLVSGRAES